MEQKSLTIYYLITKSNFGGAQRYVYDLAIEAKNRGHEVTVVFGGAGTLKGHLEKHSIETISIDTMGRDIKILADFKSFVFLCKLFLQKSPDIIHLNSSKMGGLGASAARIVNGWFHLLKLFGGKRLPMRIIFTGHGWAFNEERTDLERFAIGVIHWLTIVLAHETIAVSKRTRDQVAVLPFVWHRLTVIYNGRDKTEILSRTAARDIIFDEQNQQLLSNSPIVIGTIAELHRSKGLTYAILGVAQIKKQRPDAQLLFVIIGEEGGERTLLEYLISKHSLENNVILAGRKDNASALLSAFDVFLLPSITEAFPYAILEAGNAGLPVIATAVGGIPEVIDDMESGILIQSKNSSEIARAILYLIDNPTRRMELGNALAERIANRFSVNLMAEKTFALYSETLNKSRKTPLEKSLDS